MNFRKWLLSERTLYHGTLKDYADSIRDFGLQGGWHGPVGSFVSQHYSDEDYGEPDENDEQIFMADRQTLGKAVSAMVHHISEKLGKSFHSVTDNDIRNHGLLVIIKDGDLGATQYDPDDRYQNPPRGAEPEDWYAPKMMADMMIHGPALLRFLRSNGQWPRMWGPETPERDKLMRGHLGAMGISRGLDKEKVLSTIQGATSAQVKDQLRKWSLST